MLITNLFNRFFQKKTAKPIRDGVRRTEQCYWVNEGPGYISGNTPPDPYYSLSRWVLIQGSYFEPHVAGAFLLDVANLADWADNHYANVFCSYPANQSARAQFTVQCRDPERNNEDYISIPKGALFQVLNPYLLDFIEKGVVKVWCAHCGAVNSGAVYSSMNETSEENFSSSTVGYSCKSCRGIIDQGPQTLILF